MSKCKVCGRTLRFDCLVNGWWQDKEQTICSSCVEDVSTAATKYLLFNKFKQVNKKTFQVDILTKGREYLGKIIWFSRWRKYVFEPYQNTIYDSKCLEDIIFLISFFMEERKVL